MPDVNRRNCTPLARTTTPALAARRGLMAQPVLTAIALHGETHGQ